MTKAPLIRRLKSRGGALILSPVSTLVLNLDSRLKQRLADLAALSRKPLPDWAAEQLTRLVADAQVSLDSAYSPEWLAAFGSVTDASFEAPVRALPRAVKPLDAE